MEWTCCRLVSALLDRMVVSLRPLRRGRSLREVCAEEEREEHRCAVALSAVALSGACCSSATVCTGRRVLKATTWVSHPVLLPETMGGIPSGGPRATSWGTRR